MFKKAFQRGRSERGGEAYPLGYVESLSDARTKLKAFFNILLRGLVWERRKPRHLLAFQKLQRCAATGGDE